jgi:hypothetical protein
MIRRAMDVDGDGVVGTIKTKIMIINHKTIDVVHKIIELLLYLCKGSTLSLCVPPTRESTPPRSHARFWQLLSSSKIKAGEVHKI